MWLLSSTLLIRSPRRMTAVTAVATLPVAANLFRPAYRSAVKASRTEQDPPLGLFGGEKAVRSKLSEASKEDDLLAKTIDKPSRSRKSYKGKQTKFRRSNRRSRSRSRSRRSRSRSRGSPHRTRSKKQKVSSSKA